MLIVHLFVSFAHVNLCHFFLFLLGGLALTGRFCLPFYDPGLNKHTRTDGQGGDNVHVVVYQPSSVKARQFKIS